MSAQVDSLLETLSTELANEEFDSARSTVADLEAEFEAKRNEEVERLDKSRAIYTDVDSEASITDAAELNALSGIGGGTEFIRAMLLTVATTLIESHEELAAEGRLAEVTDIAQAAIEELADSENRFEEQTASAQEVIDRSEVPPSIRIRIDSVSRRSFPVEEETTIQTTVKNVGEAVADAVEVQIDSTDGLTTGTDSRTIGSLGDSEATEFTVQAVGTETGGHSIDLRVESENAGTDLAGVLVTILEERSPLIEYTNEEGIVETDGLRDAVSDWQGGDIDTDLLREVVDAWQSGEQIN